MQLVSLVIITRNRSSELFATLDNVRQQDYSALEIIVVENGSEPEVTAYNQGYMSKYPEVAYTTLPENLGVSGGRNVALQKASGDYIFELDDDAIIVESDAVSKAVHYMRGRPNVGVLALKIVNFYSRTITPMEFPFRDKSRNPDKEGPCAWFIGAGHIFSRGALQKVGLYRDYFPWGSEEADLALRLLDEGFDIVYFPSITILHKKAPGGRIENIIEFAATALKNRIKLAALNLPWYSIVTYAIVRSIQSVSRYRSIFVVTRAARKLAAEWPYIAKNRRKLKPLTIRRLRQLKGALYF